MMDAASKIGVHIGMVDPVTAHLFVEDGPSITKELIEHMDSLASSNDKLKINIEYVDNGRSSALKTYRIQNWPCVVLEKNGFSRIRYYGVPSGYETQALKDAISELSASKPRLSHLALESMSKVKRKVNIKVFVLTSCPFCPTVARHAYRAAISSEHVVSEVIDTSVFQSLALRHSVMGVPKMVLNDNIDITGAVDEIDFFERLRDAELSLLDNMYG